jgi:16S rRNA (guanine966-N2)-methyltransferase|tara:strand:+ start:487 stop:1032 length:546 start_codon:yes stop_codon:yes gene_type:complete
MRIISGTKKSISIRAPKNLPVRPTTDKVKESLFNIISNKFNYDELIVLDLFSGTGNISYEFASRGCSEILSIDNNNDCIKFINKTSSILELNIQTKKIDYEIFLKNQKKSFDIIFADPPYNFSIKQYIELIDLIKKNEILRNEGEIIIEHSSNITLKEYNKNIEERKYGSSILSIIKKASL